MVEEDIDDDSCKAAAIWVEEFFALQKERVIVGEAVDAAMEHDAGDE